MGWNHISKYFLCISLLIINTVFVFQYKIKLAFKTKLDNQTEMINIKWLSNLFISFASPMLVFFFNQTPNYSILRFNKDLVLILLVGITTGIYIISSIHYTKTKPDLNSINMKKREPVYVLFGLIAISYIFLRTSDAWIVKV